MSSSTRTRLSPGVRRRQILDVARAMFASRPYADVSISDVAAEAGVTRALVHHYFGGVRDLFIAVLDEIAVEGVAIPGRIEGVERTERVERNIDAWLELTLRNRETWMAVFVHAGASPDPEIQELVEARRSAAIARIIEANADLIDDGKGTQLAMRALFAAHQAACLQWFAGEVTREQVRSLLTGMFLDMVERTIPRVDDAATST